MDGDRKRESNDDIVRATKRRKTRSTTDSEEILGANDVDGDQTDTDDSLCPFDVLPDEMLVHIAMQLRNPRDVVALARTCSRWNQCAREEWVWREIYRRQRGRPFWWFSAQVRAVHSTPGRDALQRFYETRRQMTTMAELIKGEVKLINGETLFSDCRVRADLASIRSNLSKGDELLSNFVYLASSKGFEDSRRFMSFWYRSLIPAVVASPLRLKSCLIPLVLPSRHVEILLRWCGDE